MELSLSDEQRILQKTLREFSEREIAPFALEWDVAERMDRALVGRLAELGILGGTLPEQFGGSGLDYLSYCVVMSELGRADASVRGIVSVNASLVGKTILSWGTDDQCQTWLPPLCSGEKLGCFALTEPGSGSDAAALQTAARRDGDDWTINGSKMFITNGTWAGVALVFARTSATGSRGITAFLVPTDAPGFSARQVKNKLGLRAADTAELFFDDVRVPGESVLGQEGEGFSIAMSALDNGRMSLAAGCVGLMEGCLDASITYATNRMAFGRPIAQFQLIQALIADMAVELEAARLLTFNCAALADAKQPYGLESSYAKYFATEAAIRAADAAIQIHGGYGYVEEYGVAKYLRDARATTLYEGTSQIQKLIIGRALTGHSAFS